METAVSVELNQRVKFAGTLTVNEVGEVELNEATPVKGIQLLVVTSKKEIWTKRNEAVVVSGYGAKLN